MIAEQISFFGNTKQENESLTATCEPSLQEIIDFVLTDGSNQVSDRKILIFNHLKTHRKIDDNVSFLKNEYGNGGGNYLPLKDWHIHYDGKGIDFFKCTNAKFYTFDLIHSMTWNAVVKRIRELIYLGKYLPADYLKEHNYEP